MERPELMEILSRVSFATASTLLMLLALALVVYGALDLIASLSTSWPESGDAILTAIGYVVIAIAVFDVLVLLRRGWIAAEWGKSDSNRRAKFYKLTRSGRAQLKREVDAWQALVHSITRVLTAPSTEA